MRFPILTWCAPLSTPTNTLTNYMVITTYNFGALDTNDSLSANTSQVVPVAMSLRNLTINMSNTAPGAGKSWRYTVQKNGVDTALSVLISDSATGGTNNTDVVTFAPGDTMRMALYPTNSPTSASGQFSMLGETLGTDTQPFIMTIPGTVSNSANKWGTPMGGGTTSSGSAVNMLMPCSGIFSNLRMDLRDAPTSGKSYALTLTQNGSNTALSTTVADAATSNKDTTNQVRVAAGDYVTFAFVPTGTPTATGGTYSVLFTPDIKGESAVPFITFASTSNSSTTYNPAYGAFGSGSAPAWDANESLYYLRQGLPVGGTVTNMYLRTGLAPGVGKSNVYKLRKNATDTSVAVTIADNNTTGNAGGFNENLAAGDMLTYSATPVNTPSTSPIAAAYNFRIPGTGNSAGGFI